MAANSTTTTAITTSEDFKTICSKDNMKSTTNNNYKTENWKTSVNACVTEWKVFIGKLKWFNITLLTVIHAIWIWGLFQCPYSKIKEIILFNYLFGYGFGFGVTAGAHRLWTHRSYKAKLPLRIILMICYCTAGHNPLFNWVRDHRVHHKFTDTDADPHNSKRGFFFAHMGWLLMKKHPDVTQKGKEVDMSDLLSDPVIKFHQKYYVPLVLTFAFILPTIIPPLCWGSSWIWSFLIAAVGRYVITLHVTWLVNSAAHMWGTKPFDKTISPTNNLVVSIFTSGEGWHNYHHQFPWDYKADELGGHSANTTTLLIDLFAKIGWAYDLKKASPALAKKIAEKMGDGSHPLWGEVELPDIAEVDVFQCSLENDNEKSD